MPVEDQERQSLLHKDKNDKLKQYPSLPWSQVAILGIWRATHVRLFMLFPQASSGGLVT